MKLKYDEKADALTVRFTDDPIVESEEVRSGLVVDLDANGKIVAIEVLDARETLAPEALAQLAVA